MLVYVDKDINVKNILGSKPRLDRETSISLAEYLFPAVELEELNDESDFSYSLLDTNPPDDEVYVGCFPGLSIVAAKEFGSDCPSSLSKRFLNMQQEGTIYLHAMHSVVDWFAFGKWVDGNLKRSLSLSPDSGIIEDIGKKLSFEKPYWSGCHSPIDPEEDDFDYPFPFHPLELGEAALYEFFGFNLEGPINKDRFEPEEIPLVGLQRF